MAVPDWPARSRRMQAAPPGLMRRPRRMFQSPEVVMLPAAWPGVPRMRMAPAPLRGGGSIAPCCRRDQVARNARAGRALLGAYSLSANRQASPGYAPGGARVEGVVIVHRACCGAASRRAVLRGLASASTLALAGCAGMGAAAPRFDASGLASDPVLLVATTRKPVDGARAAPWYGTERSPALNVARARLAPPSSNRFSLAAVGLDDWGIAAIEPAASVGGLIAPAA